MLNSSGPLKKCRGSEGADGLDGKVVAGRYQSCVAMEPIKSQQNDFFFPLIRSNDVPVVRIFPPKRVRIVPQNMSCCYTAIGFGDLLSGLKPFLHHETLPQHHRGKETPPFRVIYNMFPFKAQI